jgi:hypothetical protein
MPRVSYRTIAPAATRSIDLAEVLAGAMQGKLNIGGSTNLGPGTSTVITDSRIGTNSLLVFNATTAAGPAVLATLWVQTLGKGTVTVAHTNVVTAIPVSYAVIG